jgi:hypothetical protein
MDELFGLLGTASTVASGGIFGLLGSGIGAWFKSKEAAKERDFEKDKWEFERETHQLNLEQEIRLGQTQLESSQMEGSFSGLLESIKHDNNGGSTSMWVSNIKALFRPFLTTLLWVVSAWIYYITYEMPGLTAQGEYMVYTVFFSAATATSWWFGDRAFAPPQLKHK